MEETGPVRVVRASTVDEIMAAEHLFDHPAQADAATRFLAEPGHHLLLAYAEGKPVGMVTGVEMTHPDKGTEMFLYELGVDEGWRRQGIGSALTRALAELAQARGCYGMWVLTERSNQAAMATYSSSGADSDADAVSLNWTFA